MKGMTFNMMLDPVHVPQQTETAEYIAETDSWSRVEPADTYAACETAIANGDQGCVIMSHPHEYGAGIYTLDDMEALLSNFDFCCYNSTTFEGLAEGFTDPKNSTVEQKNGCCSNNYKDCDAGWCGSTEEACNACYGGLKWIEDPDAINTTCLARWVSGCSNSDDCCPGLTCQDDGMGFLSCRAPPTPPPTMSPTPPPTNSPTASPATPEPTASPTTAAPTSSPKAPTASPTTPLPTSSPTTPAPTAAPTTAARTKSPTKAPTAAPTTPEPTALPTTAAPTVAPTTAAPTKAPTMKPASSPTTSPTKAPTRSPTKSPTPSPTLTRRPTSAPTVAPTTSPTLKPTSPPGCCSQSYKDCDAAWCGSTEDHVPVNSFLLVLLIRVRHYGVPARRPLVVLDFLVSGTNGTNIAATA